MLLGQPRCSIVAVTAAGWPAVPGCGAGVWDSRACGKAVTAGRERGRGLGRSADWPGSSRATASIGALAVHDDGMTLVDRPHQ